MTINGYEQLWQVRDHLRALERERARGDLTKPHLEAIAAEQARFEAEAARMEREGEGDPGANPLLGTRTPEGACVK